MLTRTSLPAPLTSVPQSQHALTWSGEDLSSRLLVAFCRGGPQFRGKRRLYDWVGAHVFRRRCTLRNDDGVRVSVDPTDYIGRMMLFDGCYEPLSLARATTIMSGGGVFVDVGCNFGLYTLSLARIPGVRSIAIDASFVALTKLRENLRLNPGGHTQIVNCALAASNTIECLDLPEARNLGTTKVADKTMTSAPADSRFFSAATTLQQILNYLKPEGVRLLKIDVEGFEMEVFRGLDFDGPFRPEHVIVECDPEFTEAMTCFNFLMSQGYRGTSVTGTPVRDCQDLPEHNVWFH